MPKRFPTNLPTWKGALRRGLRTLPALLALWPAVAAGAAEKIPVLPETLYDRYLIYESLALFWVAILGLVVILRMKLREIERTQALGLDREEPDAPLLP